MITEKEKENAALLDRVRRLYFIGIGGISMHALAIMAVRRGYTVSGTDRQKTDKTEALEAQGVTVNYGHRAENVEGSEAVIYTAAVARGCPELDRARELGIPCLTRAAFLGYLMCGYGERIGVAGMHGKSTATSMTAYALVEGEKDPTVVNGVELDILDGVLRLGGTGTFLFEACEYTDSFLSFFPTVAVALNIDLDHTDYFRDLDQIRDSFTAYLSRARIALVNADDDDVMTAAGRSGAEIVTFGIEKEADYRAVNLSERQGMFSFDLIRRGEPDASFTLCVPGRHNVYNALAAAAAADLCGVSPAVTARALVKFRGAHRRFEAVGCVRGRQVFDDYAHHPAEIEATLAAAARRGSGRVICIFQPHTYSRTAELFDRFAAAFGKADRVIFTDIFAARETDTRGVSSEMLAAATPRARYAPSFEEAARMAMEESEEGDLILTMGAGDVWRVGRLLK